MMGFKIGYAEGAIVVTGEESKFRPVINSRSHSAVDRGPGKVVFSVDRCLGQTPREWASCLPERISNGTEAPPVPTLPAGTNLAYPWLSRWRWSQKPAPEALR